MNVFQNKIVLGMCRHRFVYHSHHGKIDSDPMREYFSMEVTDWMSLFALFGNTTTNSVYSVGVNVNAIWGPFFTHSEGINGWQHCFWPNNCRSCAGTFGDPVGCV